MPVLFLVTALGVLGWLVLTRRLVDGYVNGQLASFEVVGIGDGARLRPDAAAAWLSMLAAAARDGVTLKHAGPRAGFRTSAEQALLVEELGAYGAGGLAAAVNHSPHQAGYCLDIPVASPAVRAWLTRHAPSFGFLPTGEHFSTPEPWHFEWKPGLVS